MHDLCCVFPVYINVMLWLAVCPQTVLHCQKYSYIEINILLQLLGAKILYWGFALGPNWGTEVPQTPPDLLFLPAPSFVKS